MPPEPIDIADQDARLALIDLYQRDRANHIYALADLAEPFWSRSRWWRRGDAAVGLVNLGDDEFVVYAVSSAAPAESLELLSELAATLPASLVTGPLGVANAMRASGRSIRWDRTYHRYRWPTGRRPERSPVSTRRLGPEDLKAMQALYATDPGAAFFVKSMLDDGVFVGVTDGDRLVAVGGTHVRTATEAAIGAVLVDPTARGRGLGKAVTIGVIEALLDEVLLDEAENGPMPAIALNCTDGNQVAKEIYLDLGFVPGLAYEECELL